MEPGNCREILTQLAGQARICSLLFSSLSYRSIVYYLFYLLLQFFPGYCFLGVLCRVPPFFVHSTVYPHCSILSCTCLEYDASVWLPPFSALSHISAGCLLLPLLKLLLMIIFCDHSSFLIQHYSIAEGTYQNS